MINTDTVKSEIMKCDKDGNCTHYKDSSGYECWREYDRNSNLTHLKNSDGYESWFEYNEDNNLIYSKHSQGVEMVEYEKSNCHGLLNKTHWINSNGDEFWQEWDDESMLVRIKYSTEHSDILYKYDKDRIFTEIDEQEFEQIKAEKEQKEFLRRKEVSIFELMELEE